MNTKTFLIGLSAGLVGGAAAILLSTPQSGTQLRQNITTNLASAKLKLSDLTSEIINVKKSLTTLTSEAQNNMPSIINDLKVSLTEFKQEIEPETLTLKQEIEKLQNSISEIEKIIPSDKNEPQSDVLNS
ncbi:gas vesicle protein [Solibacillus sp. R5-41]|uniref:YtxH domain-containing protein n=1 Tax=Solibacillus sp. R5-41 TaxID=2048654 RepID=UPI000C1254BF|nr:YtxH domain-containing protein [Solibacillus sp. R5-41]ATP41777.1 gas vesicle protein [Solibacillus sp. R5-41]